CVAARRDVDDDLADRVSARDRGPAVDGRVPPGVVGLSQDDLLAGLHLYDRAPRAESSRLEGGGGASARDTLHVLGYRRTIDRARRCREVGDVRDDEARISDRRDLVDAHAVLVEHKRQLAVEFLWVGV